MTETITPPKLPRESHRFRQYRIDLAYGSFDEAERRAVTEFWRRENAIADPVEAERRASELVSIFRNEQDEIIGVNTAGFLELSGRTGHYFNLRMYIRARDREQGLFQFIMPVTRHHLGLAASENIRGIALLAENQKLRRPAVRRLFERRGWHMIGQDGRGVDIWLYPFPEVKLQ